MKNRLSVLLGLLVVFAQPVQASQEKMMLVGMVDAMLSVYDGLCDGFPQPPKLDRLKGITARTGYRMFEPYNVSYSITMEQASMNPDLLTMQQNPEKRAVECSVEWGKNVLFFIDTLKRQGIQ